MVVGILLAIDLTIMTTWQVSDPFYRAIKQMEPYVSNENYTYVEKKIHLHILHMQKVFESIEIYGIS